MYRDDLEAAHARIADLERQLRVAARDAQSEPLLERSGERDRAAFTVAMLSMVVALCAGMFFGALLPAPWAGGSILGTEVAMFGVIGAAWRWWVWR